MRQVSWIRIVCGVMASIAVAITGLTPSFALNAQSGMPREPRTVRGFCAKAAYGVHIPYRGWSTRDRLTFNQCLRAHANT